MVFRVHRAGFKAAALVSIAAFGIVGCGSSGSKSGRHATGPVADSVLKVGFFGALTGAGAQIGVSIKNGELLAISQYDATNPQVRVTLDSFDSQGVKSSASSGATKMINDGVVAVIGPAFPAESDVADPILEQAGIPTVSASATEASLGDHGWKYFHRVVADDDVQGAADADYLVKTLGLKKIAILDDGSAYGRGLADSVRSQAASDGAAVVASDHVDPNAADYSTSIAKVLSGDANAVFFGGYYDSAARLINQLKGKAFTGAFMSGDGSDDPAFVKDAGGAPAEGAYLSCACADTSNNADAQPFSAAYRAQFGFAPATYSAEAYDATDAVLQAIKSGATTPSTINRYLATINYEGVTKAIKFQPNGNIAANTIYIYQVKDGQIVPVGSHG